MKTYDIEWSRNLFHLLNPNGGAWAVPRSGMIFKRQDAELVLSTQMEWMEGMSITAEQLRAQQDADFDVIKKHFGAAGITVRRQEP